MSIAPKVRQATKTLNVMSARQRNWRWYHGAIFYIFAQVVSFGLAGIVTEATGQQMKSVRDTFGDVDYFHELKQAKIAPPSWVFGPAWTINNISTIWGALQVLNKPEGTPGKSTFLALQGASWVNYVVFSAAYFSLRSPINAFLLTLCMFVLTILSGLVAIFQLKDTKVAFSLATLTIWLLIALTAATFQAAWNYDELYHSGPFAEPVAGLEKQNTK
ncbi:MAG: TspO/MBR family protein [Ktedonobacteraceae bacterium]